MRLGRGWGQNKIKIKILPWRQGKDKKKRKKKGFIHQCTKHPNWCIGGYWFTRYVNTGLAKNRKVLLKDKSFNQEMKSVKSFC